MQQTIIRRRYINPQLYVPAGYIENISDITITTHIKVSSSVLIKIDFCLGDYDGSSTATLLDHRIGYNTDPVSIRKSGSNIQITFGSTTYNATWDENRHTILYSEKKVYFDDSLIIDGSSMSDFAGDGSKSGVTLFSRVRQNQNSIAPDTYSRAKIYDLIRDNHHFIPCYGKIEKKYGLYDLSTDTFLSNANLTGQLK